MQFQPLNRGSTYNMQGGLWGLEIQQRQMRYEGDDSYEEYRQGPMPSILPLMSELSSSLSSQKTLGGRCSIMQNLRREMASHFHLTSGAGDRALLPTRLIDEANSPYANESSQRIMARLLAMQLIGAGYKVSRGNALFMGSPENKPIIGTEEGFQGHGVAGVLLHGLSTRPKSVRKTIEFMQPVRSLANEFLATHNILFGSPRQMGASDQLAHRARLALLAAKPQSLQNNRPLVTELLGKLDRFEKNGISGDAQFIAGLVNEVVVLTARAENDLR